MTEKPPEGSRGTEPHAGCAASDASEATTTEESLGTTARHAALWNGAFQVFRDGLQFAVLLVLVRLLDPSAYGRFGLVTALMTFISVFSFKPILEHALQVRCERDVHYQDHFTAGGVIQALAFAATNLFAGVLWLSPEYRPTALPLHVMSIIFLLEWPTELVRTMLQREMNWRRFRTLHAAGLVLSSLLAVAMAVLGFGVYALLVPAFAVTFPFIYELFFHRRWRPTWEFDRKQFLPAARFGVSRMLSGAVSALRPLLVNGIVAQALSFTSLGVLNRALGLGAILISKVAIQLLFALYPALTRIETHSDRFRRVSALVLRLVSWTVVPVACVLSLCAGSVVTVIYGSTWNEVTPLLPIAMVLCALGALSVACYRLLLAHDGQRYCLRIDLLGLLGVLVASVGLIGGSLAHFLTGLCIAEGLVLLATLACLIADSAVTLRGVRDAVVPTALSMAVALLTVYGLRFVTGPPSTPVLDEMLTAIAFLAAYVLALRCLWGKLIGELVPYLPAPGFLRAALLLPEGP